MTADLARSFLDRVDPDEVMVWMERIVAFDRYQASRGIERAAEVVADTAREIGLEDVTVDSFRVGRGTKFWTFDAPLPWTPTAAELRVGGPDGLRLDHAHQPFSLATYSAATPAAGVRVPLRHLVGEPGEHERGCVVVVEPEMAATAGFVERLADRGILGFITDGSRNRGAAGHDAPVRIELPPGATIFAFSVSRTMLNRLTLRSRDDAMVSVRVIIDESASMPVVTARLPGTGDGEVWLTAHLCHPRPSANDNASGVGALLGVARALDVARKRRGRPELEESIRFVWGPEFVGMAGYLHGRLATGASLPSAVINLDMVGEDQVTCGSPFLVERHPETLTGPLVPLADTFARLVFDLTSSQPGTWQSIPYEGFSDHALFADPSIGRPAIGLAHAPDRFNHSAADDMAKVSRIELGRSMAIAGALANTMAIPSVLSSAGILAAITRWHRRELARAHRFATALGAQESSDWPGRFMDHVRKRALGMPDAIECGVASKGPPASPRPVAGVLHRVWQGPFNARAMIGSMPTAKRLEITHLFAHDRAALSLLSAFAIRIDGQTLDTDIVELSSFDRRRQVPSELAGVLLEAFTAAGWADRR